MFLAKPGEYKPCGLFTTGHFILIALAITGIIIALKCTINKIETKKVIKRCTIFIWIFEIIIILFKLLIAETRHVNNYVPLYYCSILLYAGLLSSFGKGNLKRIGDVFIATGGIIGGIVFLFFPTTSLPTYPMIHIISFHSFTFHSVMIYLGLLVNITNYVELKNKDIINYAGLVGIICLVAYIVNQIFNGNLMFISKNFPSVSIINWLYNATGKLFTPVMILIQTLLPFYVVYGIRKLKKKKIK